MRRLHRHVGFVPILLKKSKIEKLQNLANVDFWTSPPLGCCIAPRRKSVVVFLRNDVVSHIVAHETHQRLWKISFATPKRLFQQYLPLTEVAPFYYSSITSSELVPLTAGKR